ncbi:MAG: OmpH family outer membrane protein [Phycisphaerae bacterium]|nr:OmpH family outer membrane protein [Phycisphaerae bacterium]
MNGITRRARSRSSIVLAAGLLGAGLLAAAAVQTAAPPTAVAVIDLEIVYEKLDQHRASETVLSAMVDKLAEEGRQREQAVKAIQIEIEAYEKGSDKLLEMQRNVEDAVGRLAAFQDYARLKTERESERLVKETYDQVKLACAAVAKERGIQLVLLDDATPAFAPEDRRPMMQQISARRSLFVDPSLDITSLVIERMNKEFAAKSTAAPSPQ